jgi:hypothetical protein
MTLPHAVLWNKASQAQLSIMKFKMFQQGKIMKKQYLAVLFTLICVLGLGLSARAQEQDTVFTNAPFDFVAGGKVLPAGKYTVNRVAPASGSRELEMRSYETRASVFVLPTVFDDIQSGKAQLNFEHLGDAYFLSAIQTPIGTYTIDIPPSAIKLAQTQPRGGSHPGGN